MSPQAAQAKACAWGGASPWSANAGARAAGFGAAAPGETGLAAAGPVEAGLPGGLAWPDLGGDDLREDRVTRTTAGRIGGAWAASLPKLRVGRAVGQRRREPPPCGPEHGAAAGPGGLAAAGRGECWENPACCLRRTTPVGRWRHPLPLPDAPPAIATDPPAEGRPDSGPLPIHARRVALTEPGVSLDDCFRLVLHPAGARSGETPCAGYICKRWAMRGLAAGRRCTRNR